MSVESVWVPQKSEKSEPKIRKMIMTMSMSINHNQVKITMMTCDGRSCHWGQMYRNVMSFIHVILSLMGSWSVARFIVLCFSLSIQKSKSITNPNAFLNHSFIH